MRIVLHKGRQMEYLYLLVYAFYSYVSILNTSLLDVSALYNFSRVICAVLLGFLSLVILFRRRFRVWTFLIFACIIVAFGLAAIFSDRLSLLFLAFFIFCASLVDFKAIVKTSIVIDVAALLTILFLLLIGIIPNYTITHSNGTSAMCLGFDYYSYFSFIVMYIIIMYLYLRYKKITWIELFIMLAISLVCNILTSVRVAFFVGIIALVLDAYIVKIRYRPLGNNRSISFLATIAYPIGFLALLGVTLSYLLYRSSFAVSINSFLNNRIRMNALALQRYPVTLFGQEVVLTGGSATKTVDNYFYIDSGTVYSLIVYGVIITIIALIIYSYMFRISYKKNEKVLFIWILAVWVFSFINNTWLTISYNPLILYFGCTVLSQRQRRREIGESVEQVQAIN